MAAAKPFCIFCFASRTRVVLLLKLLAVVGLMEHFLLHHLKSE